MVSASLTSALVVGDWSNMSSALSLQYPPTLTELSSLSFPPFFLYVPRLLFLSLSIGLHTNINRPRLFIGSIPRFSTIVGHGCSGLQYIYSLYTYLTTVTPLPPPSTQSPLPFFPLLFFTTPSFHSSGSVGIMQIGQRQYSAILFYAATISIYIFIWSGV